MIVIAVLIYRGYIKKVQTLQAGSSCQNKEKKKYLYTNVRKSFELNSKLTVDAVKCTIRDTIPPPPQYFQTLRVGSLFYCKF